VSRSVTDLGLTAETPVRAVAFQPTDRRNITAVVLTLQETGQWVGSWTPWHGAMTLAGDTAFRLPAGAHVVAEFHHLRPGGGDDRGTVGLYRAPAAAPQPPRDVNIVAKRVPATANAPAGPLKFTGSVTLDTAVKLLAFNPEVQPGVQSVEISARKPNGAVDVLLLVRDPLSDWPTPYILKDGIALPAGTQLVLTDYVDTTPTATPQALRTVVSLMTGGNGVASATK
jgi:hypothetical protein